MKFVYTGKTKNLGIIGYPVEHSLSPAMQSAAIEEAGLDYRYIAMSVEPKDLREAVIGLKRLHFRGFNVTIPHKIQIIPLLDQIDEHARMIGAVNTVLIEGDKMYGYNTDSLGFIASLKASGFSIEGKRAVLLGAGGAARAVIWGLIANGIESLSIGVRNVERAAPLVAVFKEFIQLRVFHWEESDFQRELHLADLLVHTTPLGMFPKTDVQAPVDWSIIQKSTFICDLIYTPAATLFLNTGIQRGNRTMNGQGMLVEQGAKALEIWTGGKVSTEVMKRALEKSLKEIN